MPIDPNIALPNIALQAQSPDMMKQAQGVLGIAQSAQNLRQTRFNLNQQQLQAVQDQFTSLARDPDVIAAEKEQDPMKLQEASGRIVRKLFDNMDLAIQSGVPRDKAQMAIAQYIAAAHNPREFRQYLAQRVQAGVGAASQLAQTQVPAGQSQQIKFSPQNLPYIESTDEFGNKTLLYGKQVGNRYIFEQPTPQPTTGPVEKPTPSKQMAAEPAAAEKQGPATVAKQEPKKITPSYDGAMPMFPTPQQQEAAKTGIEHINQVRTAGDQIGQQSTINQNILRLSRDTDTGPGSSKWQKVLGGVSAFWGGTEQVNNYQELGKYLEKNAIAGMTAMGGPPSDARLSASMAANGSTEFNARALQDVTKFNDAINTALGKYRNGMDIAVGMNNERPLAVSRFRAQWAHNFDPNVFRLENAIRDKDTMELEKLKKELGSEGLVELLEKKRNLQSLATSGHLPRK